MRSPVLVILIPLIVAFCVTCKQKVDIVLPPLGLYEGRITNCYGEEIIRIDSMMDTTTMSFIKDTVRLPYLRRVTVTFVDQFVADNDSIVNAIGVKGDKKFLVIATSWLCQTEYDSLQSPLDTLGSEILSEPYPVVVEVKNTTQGRTNLVMVEPSQVMLDLGGNSTIQISELTGFYYAGALQLDYLILKDGRGEPMFYTTMIAMKN